MKSARAVRKEIFDHAANEWREDKSGARLVMNTLDEPRRVGRYELLIPLARGGMGEVWIARRRHASGFEKLFAVKTLLTHLSPDPQIAASLLDEARIVARTDHPNVAQIVDVEEQAGVVSVVFEWVEGVTLHALAHAARVRGRSLPLGVVLRVLADACAGLDAVHDLTDREGRPLHVVHRDVSPQNVMVSRRGFAKLIDFGVAHSRNRLAGSTGKGVVKGKVRFMAPEQARGERVDRRADVWGIGASLLHTIAGVYPYPGESDVDFFRAILHGAAPAIPRDLQAPLRSVLERALAVDPAARYASAGALGEDLERAARDLGVSASAREVAAMVRVLAGDDLARLRAEIETARASTLDARACAPTMPSFDEATVVGSSRPPPKRRRTMRALKLLAFLGVAGLGGGVGIGAAYVAISEPPTVPVRAALAELPSPSTSAAATAAAGSAPDGASKVTSTSTSTSTPTPTPPSPLKKARSTKKRGG